MIAKVDQYVSSVPMYYLQQYISYIASYWLKWACVLYNKNQSGDV